ncbi:MAG: hypothetical protein OHK005_05200 [Candidatus Methylacidiphilales bacterium]
MKIGLAIWPQRDAEWIELSLSAISGVTVEMVGDRESPPEEAFDILVVDPDSPGPAFLRFYNAIIRKFGPPAMVVLGPHQASVMFGSLWEATNTIFAPKPVKIEEVRAMVTRLIRDLESEAYPPGTASPKPHRKTQGIPVQKRNNLGYLSTLRLSDLIQMLTLNNWAGKIEVTDLGSGQTGAVYLNVGVLIHAECGSHVAEEACYRMLSWGRCEFQFIEEHPPVVQTIKTHWQHVILEGARLLDDSSASSG